MEIPDNVLQAALFPSLDLPDPPPGHPYQVVRRTGYTIGMFAGMPLGNAAVSAIDPAHVEAAIEHVHAVLREHGKNEVAWFVPEAASPPDLAQRLLRRGATPFDKPPFEARFASMVTVRPPAPGPPDIIARPAESFEEFRASGEVANAAFDVSKNDRLAYDAQARLLWEIAESGGAYRTFVAIVDGEIVGSGGAIYGANAVYLSGGSTNEDVRGRGVYRALVRARWDAAVERRTPALTVLAGKMSRPILERLGFATVGWVDCLSDRLVP